MPRIVSRNMLVGIFVNVHGNRRVSPVCTIITVGMFLKVTNSQSVVL